MAGNESGYWRARLKAEAAQKRAVVQRLVDSCKSSDWKNFAEAMIEVDARFIHKPAFRALARLDKAPAAAFRRLVRDLFWLRAGDHFRSEVGDDLLLCDALRVLMPPYRGPALQLYRGEIAHNRRCRTYSVAWTASREVADSFAQGIMRTCQGGSVVIETVAPPAAIICRIPHSSDRYSEREYLVDRRHLDGARVVTRYSQIPIPGASVGPNT